MITYNKLVRDRVIDIIKESGKTYEARKLNNDEFLLVVQQKFTEEALEFQNAETKKDQIEELADIFDLVHAAINALDISYEELEQVRLEKRKKRGGFEQKILLESTEK